MTTVLIVEDEPDIRAIARLQLEGAGYTVADASDGVEAFALLEGLAPDALLLDVQMPRMGGLEFLERLRQTQPKGLPVVIFSANDTPAVLEKMAALGYQGLVSKPYRTRELLKAVAGALDQVPALAPAPSEALRK